MNWNDIYTYNKETGELLRKRGKQGQCKDAYGYILTGHNYKLYKSHRIIWEMHFGAIPDGMVVDHINRIVDDNRLENLRLATKAGNAYNAKTREDNKSGVCGVNFSKHMNKYRAYITIDKKQKHLGFFENIEDAIKARQEAEKNIPYISRG